MAHVKRIVAITFIFNMSQCKISYIKQIQVKSKASSNLIAVIVMLKVLKNEKRTKVETMRWRSR